MLPSLLNPLDGMTLAISASPIYGVIGALVLLFALILKPIACVTLSACAGAIVAAASHGSVSIGKAVAVGIGIGASIAFIAGIAFATLGRGFYGTSFVPLFIFAAFNAVIYYALPIIVTSHLVTSMSNQPAGTPQKSLLVGIKGGIIFASIGFPFNLVGHPTFGAFGALLGPLVIATSAIIITVVTIRRMRRATG